MTAPLSSRSDRVRNRGVIRSVVQWGASSSRAGRASRRGAAKRASRALLRPHLWNTCRLTALRKA